MALRKAERAIKVFPMPPFSGGLSSSPAQDNECAVFENATLVRDNWLRTRPGTYLAHAPGAINNNPITGIFCGGLGEEGVSSGLYVVVVKSDGTGHYHRMQPGWKPGDQVSFGSFTLPYGDLYECRFLTAGVKL